MCQITTCNVKGDARNDEPTKKTQQNGQILSAKNNNYEQPEMFIIVVFRTICYIVYFSINGNISPHS